MICLPIGGGAPAAMGDYLSRLAALRPVLRWQLGGLELVLMCTCLVMLCLIAPRFRDP